MDGTYRVYLAMGTNIGHREDNLKQAITKLPPEVMVMTLSQVYETAPAYVLDQPAFLNMVVEGQTRLSPTDLLDYLKHLEQEIGRTPSIRYGPRKIDLDIIFFEDDLLELPHLQIPHPRMQERDFVLRPLADIAPHFIHPQLGKSVSQLLADLPADKILDSFEFCP